MGGWGGSWALSSVSPPSSPRQPAHDLGAMSHSAPMLLLPHAAPHAGSSASLADMPPPAPPDIVPLYATHMHMPMDVRAKSGSSSEEDDAMGRSHDSRPGQRTSPGLDTSPCSRFITPSPRSKRVRFFNAIIPGIVARASPAAIASESFGDQLREECRERYEDANALDALRRRLDLSNR